MVDKDRDQLEMELINKDAMIASLLAERMWVRENCCKECLGYFGGGTEGNIRNNPKSNKGLKMETESDFREMLKQKGFTVNEKHESDNSVDIVAIRNGAYFLIDIKTASTDNRIRHDTISNDAEFGIALCNNGWFYPVGVKAGKHAKVYRFMSMM